MAKYIKEQINSILPQLMNGDELIVVDDNSTDGTADIIRSYQSKYIKLIINPHNIGHVRTFEKAIIISYLAYCYLCFASIFKCFCSFSLAIGRKHKLCFRE